jgi:imidazolonepropionase-like amidohydrolase
MPLTRLFAVFALGFLAILGAAPVLRAQNLLVTNARIIVGNGQVIENGSIVVQAGRIVSVAPGNQTAPAGAQTIDASGFTVMAGFMDGHRHLVGGGGGAGGGRGAGAGAGRGAGAAGGPGRAGGGAAGRGGDYLTDRAPAEMMELLEAGVTTVQSGGDAAPTIYQLKQKIESGEMKGPRVVTSGPSNFSNLQTEDEVRAAVRKDIMDGADSIAEIHFPAATYPGLPTDKETRFLSTAIDEAKKFHVMVQIHAVSPPAMMAAVRAGGTELVHTPHFEWVTEADAKEVKDSGALVSSCTGFGVPVFDVFNHDNIPTFRDGGKWPDSILDGQGRGREAGYKPVNGRTLFDAGVPYGYCTDTTYQATAALAQELRTLNLMFSPIDLVKIMGPNSAAFLGKSKDFGTIEPGKVADMIVLTGNPLKGYWNFLTDVMTIKGGEIVVDKRSQLKTVRVLP